MAPAARPCRVPSCFNLKPCPVHGERIPYQHAQRSSSLYGTARWKQTRAYHLSIEPQCRSCGDRASFVDHIIPPRGNDDLFWDTRNYQSLCRRCSNIKTAAEVRGRKQ